MVPAIWRILRYTSSYLEAMVPAIWHILRYASSYLEAIVSDGGKLSWENPKEWRSGFHPGVICHTHL